MASEDSHFLNALISSSSVRRRLPPRFIGPRSCEDLDETVDRQEPTCSDHRGDLTEDRQIAGLRKPKREPLEAGEHPRLELFGLRQFEVPDPVAPASRRPGVEDRLQEAWCLLADLRHVARQRDAERKSTIMRSTDRNVEASSPSTNPAM